MLRGFELVVLVINLIIHCIIAVGISIVSMQVLREVHASADANLILIIMSGTNDYTFLFTLLLFCSILLVNIALIVKNIDAGTCWSNY